jgi:hypothetical protein
MVNRDQIEELRDDLGEHGSIPREDLAQWLLLRRRERFTYQPQAVMRKKVGPDAVPSELEALEQDVHRCRTWTNR